MSNNVPFRPQTNAANRKRMRDNNRSGGLTSRISSGAADALTAAAAAAALKGAEAAAGGDKLNVNMLAYPLDTAAFAQGHYVIFQLHSTTNGRLVKEDQQGGGGARRAGLDARAVHLERHGAAVGAEHHQRLCRRGASPRAPPHSVAPWKYFPGTDHLPLPCS